MSSLSEMKDRLMQGGKPQTESIYFAHCADDVVAVKVVGRGSHTNSPALQMIADRFFSENERMRFIIDLAECQGMDSTFMGTLAGLTLRQKTAGTGLTIITHVTAQNRRSLDVLGLAHVLDVREDCANCEVPDSEFLEGRKPDLSKVERTLHMIEAHERLVNIDTNNEVRFQGVLEFLHDSLEREQERLQEEK